jgi:hypothetical protein
MPDFPSLPAPRPPTARQHCRHYSYVLGVGLDNGPKCAVACDNDRPGGTAACMPNPNSYCGKREEWTEAERDATRAWTAEHMERLALIMERIPRTGDGGTLPCPACGVGTVGWSRARRNGHLHAACTTPQCFAVMS